jgi:ornithine carbamoyltransferase
MCIGAPESLWPDAASTAALHEVAKTSGGAITFAADPQKSVAGADFVYTDVWLSMGEDEHLWGDRIKLLLPYQINAALLAATGNPAVKFMHCLPAFHNAETAVGQDIEKRFGITAMEVTEEVFESPASIVFDQAENRLHSIKAILVATLA